MSKTIKFIKKEGDVLHKEYVLNNLENSFKTIPNGEHIINISKLVKKRTIDQNKLMWLWFACIEMETGTNKNDIHDYYCMLFLRRTASINGEDRVIISGTSKLNTDQFTDFLNKIQADAATEFGIKLPTPDDLYFESFKQEYGRYIHY